jgi:SAM-dependent methyltransferase
MRISRVISAFVPGPLRDPARDFRNFVNYEFGVRVLRRDVFLPPRGFPHVGDGDYRKVGEEFLNYFRTLGGLTPQDRVLDIGCGTGRMALPLTRFLNGGTYDGFDLAKPAVNWCRYVYSRRYPHFRFYHLDIHSDLYNDRGQERADKSEFPFPSDTFDFVFLTSVFTHMLPAAVRNYLAEIRRVMKPGGTCLATFFLITPESHQLMKSGVAEIEFIGTEDRFYIADPEHLEAAVAYPEDMIREFYRQSGFQIIEPIRCGSWCGRKDGLSFQDIVVARR